MVRNSQFQLPNTNTGKYNKKLLGNTKQHLPLPRMKGHNVVEIRQRHNVGILGHNMHAPQWGGPGIPAENQTK